MKPETIAVVGGGGRECALEKARDLAYKVVSLIRFTGMHYQTDIAA